ncbi:MAG: T9SS type A sorting domain-containing protein [Weeksellaceae bacterium]|nr:T9SS type A sorting domain-containing protein [Weeksellaceae bacterium]
MKKYLFSMLAVASMTIASAQVVISFESSEGYIPGDINGQNGWTVTGAGEGAFITEQHIVAENATHGEWSFNNAHEDAFPPQQSAIVGATLELATPIATTDLVFAYDITTDVDPDGESGDYSDFVFWLFNEGGAFIQAINFNYQNSIQAIGTNAEGGAAWISHGEFTRGSTYEVSLENMGTSFGLSINGESLALIPIMNEGNIATIRMTHDNYAGNAYYDNVRLNAHLSTNDVAGAVRGSVVYPNPVKDVLNVRLAEGFDAAKTSVNVLNTAGQRVAAFKNVSDINLSRLAPGVYIVEITDGVNTETKKMIKR